MIKLSKEDKAITLIALIITVVLILILASVTTYYGIDTYKRTKVTKFVTQMQLIQGKVDELLETNTAEDLNKLNLQTPTTQEEQKVINSAFNNGELTTNDINEYKVFTQSDILNILEVEDVENSIMVNIETREIVSLNGVEYEGTIYYTQYKLPNGQKILNSNYVARELDFTIELVLNGINSTVTTKDIKITNGTLSYKEQGDNYWQTVTNYTEKNKSYDVLISKSGEYTFKLQDNTLSENYIEKTINITLANKPKTNLTLETYNYGEKSDKWAYLQKDSVIYVWIPRFVYKTNTDTNSTDIKFIKGNSNIATDNTYINEWTLHDKFTADDGTELTGVWVNVDSLNQTELNMIDLLNDSNRTILIEI